MRILLVALVIFVGCSRELPCRCGCHNCGIECRNRCEETRCLLGDPCCDKCECNKKRPLKIK